MIIAKYDAILNQSERVHLDNHLSNDTDLNRQGKYFIVRDCSLETEARTWHLKKSSSSDDMRERFFSRYLKFRGKSNLDRVSLDIPSN